MQKKAKFQTLWDLIFGGKDFALEDKFFNGLTFLGIIGWFFSLLGNVALAFGTAPIAGALAFLTTHIIFYYISRIRHKTEILQIPFAIYSISALSFVWMNNGGIDGGALYIYNVLISICIIIAKKNSPIPIIFFSILTVICLIYIEYNYPHWITRYESLEERMVDLGISILASMFVTNIMIFLIFRNYLFINNNHKEMNLNLDNALQKIRKDLSLSGKIQKSLIAEENQEIYGFEYGVQYKPLEEVGGDIYCIDSIKPGVLRVFLADATGHGVQAALITMLIYSEYNYWKTKDLDPAATMKMLNETFISKYRSLEIFFSCVIADFDVLNKKLIYSSGGHIDQLLIKADGEIVNLPRTGVIVGFHHKSQFKNREIPFCTGDQGMLYTDGILEEFNLTSEHYGMERFKKAISEKLHNQVKEIGEHVLKDLETFMQEAETTDDITMILVKNSLHSTG